MPRIVRCAVTQAYGIGTKQHQIDKHLAFIQTAAQQRVQVLCFQELFWGPYFCNAKQVSWFAQAEATDGPTVAIFSEAARRYGMVLLVPIFEAAKGNFYNSVVVIDADGNLAGVYRKVLIPQLRGYYEDYYFQPGDQGYPIFQTQFGKIGVCICYERHFPEVGRLLGLNGAEMVFIPSACSGAVNSGSLWFAEQRVLAFSNGYFVATSNRVGFEGCEEPYFGASSLCDPFGTILAQGSTTQEEVVIADFDLDLIAKMRGEWPFYRDRRSDIYRASLVK